MSVSIDEDVAEGDEQARNALAGWLDDYSEGRCKLEQMQESFLGLCRREPEASWDALALLDQYRRRGRVSPELAQSLKAAIENIVFGSQTSSRGRVVRSHETDQQDRAPCAGAPSRSSWEQPSRAAPADGSGQIHAGRQAHDGALTHDRDALRADARPPDPATTDLESESSTPAEGAWRKLIAERDQSSTRPGTAFVDRTVLGRELSAPIIAQRRPADDSAHRISPTSAPSARTRSGEVLRGRYELVGVLGRGASGAVYHAVDRHRAHLSEAARSVAVKVLEPKCCEPPGALAEVERGFHQSQSLSHPNIARVFDLDRDGSTYFIVMELLQGRLLRDILRERNGRPMKRAHARTIIAAVGAALLHAHERGVVHGDLDPRHVMITHDGEVRVLGFGFGRGRTFELQGASLDGVSTGSPAYASAERVNGSEPDPSDDVYSFACIAYELLSGRHPFGGRSALLARAHGRRPGSVRGLHRKQSQALQRALLWTRGKRRIGVAELLGALECGPGAVQRATPAEILAHYDRKGGWLRFAILALIAAAIAAGAWLLAPQLPQARVLVSALFADMPAAVRSAAHAMRGDGADSTSPAAPEQQSASVQERTEEDPAVVEEIAEEPIATASAPLAADTESNRTGDEQASAAAQPETPNVGGDARPQVAARSAPPPVTRARLEFDRDTYVVNESDGSVQLRVRRSGSVRRAASFGWSLRGNSAESGADFAAIGPGQETMAAGAREATVIIPLVSDAIVENTEMFFVELRALQDDVELGERAHAAVIIIDDD